MPLLSTASVAEIITKLQDLEVINSKADLVSVVGSPAVNTDPLADIIADIQTAKTSLAAKLSAGGITATNTEALQSLVGKATIGKEWASGTQAVSNYMQQYYYQIGPLTVSGLSFTPSLVIVAGADGNWISQQGVAIRWNAGGTIITHDSSSKGQSVRHVAGGVITVTAGGFTMATIEEYPGYFLGSPAAGNPENLTWIAFK
jgi:hypothetical protein